MKKYRFFSRKKASFTFNDWWMWVVKSWSFTTFPAHSIYFLLQSCKFNKLLCRSTFFCRVDLAHILCSYPHVQCHSILEWLKLAFCSPWPNFSACGTFPSFSGEWHVDLRDHPNTHFTALLLQVTNLQSGCFQDFISAFKFFKSTSIQECTVGQEINFFIDFQAYCR